MMEKRETINVGDRVRLHSGSPDMLVMMITPKGDYIHAEWIEDDGWRRAHPFPADCVYKVSERGQFGNITAQYPWNKTGE